MTGRWSINALLLVGCVLLAWLARWELQPEPGLAARIGLNADAISQLRLSAGENPVIELEADSGGGWVMRAPLQGPVTERMSERLQALLRAPVTRAFALDGGDAPGAPALDDLGLAEPWLVIDLGRIRLRAGGAEPLQRRRYLQVGDEILLIDDRWLLPLLAPPKDYIAGAERADGAEQALPAAPH